MSYQRRKILTRKGFPFWAGCDSRLKDRVALVNGQLIHIDGGQIRVQ